MESIELKEKEFNVFTCSNCGGELKYKPGTTTLVCDHCNTKNEIPQEKTIIEELDFNDYLEKSESESLGLEKMIQCKSCGATSSVNESIKSFHCPYCSTPLVEEDIREERVIKPSYLLPFNLDTPKVYNLLSSWVDGLWWAPNNLKKAALSPIGLRGIYVPYWTFDVNTHTMYTGERGENYKVTTGSGDNERTQIKTRWYDTAGNVSIFFDDIMVPASGSIDPSSLAQLGPWDVNALVKINDQYLSGFVTEKYKFKLKESFQSIKGLIDNNITKKIYNDIGGDGQRINSVNTQYSNIHFKHILLPVYVSSYHYDGKIYHFYVNGRNGKMIGKRPYSTTKIALAIIIVLLILIIAALL
ncbi:hypothetical protein [Flavobacterium hydatis]|uniref:DNA helicase PriA n=1 Tax=Flavobacterium hydatis TaxID=991 RepID=A0A086A003_FLAHY|nr:hypothetical protein [Flavobacterium hydatis]KFF10017.1 hypothetical protein IW20_21280 [Flavobacterium hydatis]OXA93365.1 hypothetical protein B0A62_13990 [Flavobacterium hydatis]